jgi:uncharacterized membrane protein
MNRLSVKVAQTAMIASIYAATTIFLGPIGYSWIQLRIGEALTPLPFLLGFPAVVGLTLGCGIANLASPVGLTDLIFGTLLTLIAAILSWKGTFGKPILACLYPVIINSIGVGMYLSSFYGVPYWTTVLTVGVGEFIAAVIIGYPALLAVKKLVKGKTSRID